MLTDKEILVTLGEDKANDPELWDDLLADARKVIAAHEAKLREQRPVAWCQDTEDEVTPEFGFSWVKTRLHDMPLYLHPAPIPEGWQPIATAPIDKNVILTDGESVEEGVFFSGSWRWNRNENIAFATHWMPLPKPPMAAARNGE